MLFIFILWDTIFSLFYIRYSEFIFDGYFVYRSHMHLHFIVHIKYLYNYIVFDVSNILWNFILKFIPNLPANGMLYIKLSIKTENHFKD